MSRLVWAQIAPIPSFAKKEDTVAQQALQGMKNYRVVADDQLRPFLPCLAYRLRRDIQGYQSLRDLRFSIAY